MGGFLQVFVHVDAFDDPAFFNTCTHIGGSLGEGDLIDDTVSCPWHGAQFNIKTGEVLGPPAGSGGRSYSVKVEGKDVFVELD